MNFSSVSSAERVIEFRRLGKVLFEIFRDGKLCSKRLYSTGSNKYVINLLINYLWSITVN